MDALELKLIVGSTRPGRGTDVFLPWLIDRIERHGRFALDVLDLRDWPLPMFQETWATARAGYSDEAVRRWNAVIRQGDAFVMVTPEYNHSAPAVLKNAIDSVFVSHGFRNKPVGFVGYSGGLVGGARAVEHLAHVAVEAEAVPLRNAVLLARYHQSFVDGRPADPGADDAVTVLLDDLAWWADALRTARRNGELPPANQRRVA